MPVCQHDLPDDVDALKALVRDSRQQLSATVDLAQRLQDQLDARVMEIDALKLLIAKLRRIRFGRKSEKLDRQIDQLELTLEDLQIAVATSNVPSAPRTREKRKPARRPLPPELPRVEQVYLPDVTGLPCLRRQAGCAG